MKVVTRSGKLEKVSFDKIIDRLAPLCSELDSKYIDPILVARDTITNMYDKITTKQLDNLSADICASKIAIHPDFGKLSSRISVSNLHKETKENYMEVVNDLYNLKLVSEKFYQFVKNNSEPLQNMIDYNRDFLFDFFGFKTFERSYLFRDKIKNMIIERPQHLWMRVSIQVHGLMEQIPNETRLALIKETYDAMSLQYFTHATPTLFNSGTERPQMSSCFLMSIEDNIENIFKVAGDMGKISKFAGGIGVHLHAIRAKGSLIRGTNGKSSGIIPLCKHIESIAKYINQGGKRNGSIACYLEPWHADIFDFIDLRKNMGDENLRARDLFLALWIPDLFMKRVQEKGKWSLMCPDKCPGLSDVYGEEFEKLYCKYETEGRYNKQVEAEELWKHIIDSQIETGMPYVSFKDHVNRKSNQMNIGVIKSSNLCNEIVEVSNTNETAVCNLGSLCLKMFIEEDKNGNKVYNFEKLRKYTRILTRNLNNVIDLNYYPIPETKYSNMKNRPVGIGVQGLADVFCIMKYSFESNEARELNRKIFEHIYFAALEMSNELAKEFGPYETFKGSPFSKGLLQWHLWNVDPKTLSQELDWNKLVNDIKQYGTRNSLLTACMPTASTSQIMKNYECFEPYSSNMFLRTTLAGEYIIINEHLVRDLIKLDLWNKEIYDEIIYFNGSIQKIQGIPDKNTLGYDLKEIYKTAFEITGKAIVNLSVDRGPFIDQTQSLNIFQDIPNTSKLTSSHFYAWKHGLKTGMYYLRTKPAVDAIKFGIDPIVKKRIKDKYENANSSSSSGSSSSSSTSSGSASSSWVNNNDFRSSLVNSKAEQLSENKEDKPIICKWRKPGAPDSEPCDMCTA